MHGKDKTSSIVGWHVNVPLLEHSNEHIAPSGIQQYQFMNSEVGWMQSFSGNKTENIQAFFKILILFK